MVQQTGPMAIAYSGGVDSTLLAVVATRTLGQDRVLCLTSDNPALPRAELAEAKRLARVLGLNHRILQTEEYKQEDYAANPEDRCYYCKKHVLTCFYETAREEGFSLLAVGEHAGDDPRDRPGYKAVCELRVRCPLREAGLDKERIRALSRLMNLPTADRPSQSCLATRVPSGNPITPEVLGRIEQAEASLKAMGLTGFRVRAHGLLARIEVAPTEIVSWSGVLRGPVTDAVRKAGFAWVTLDLEGYRPGGRSRDTRPA